MSPEEETRIYGLYGPPDPAIELAHLRRIAEGVRLGLDWDESGQPFWRDEPVRPTRRRWWQRWNR